MSEDARPGADPAGLLLRAPSKLDPLGWSAATAGTLGRSFTRPGELAAASARFAGGLAALPLAAAARALALPVAPPIEPDPEDRRFSDPAWQDNPYYFAVRQLYDLTCRYSDDVRTAGRSGDVADLKTALLMSVLTEAAAPTNFLPTNPEALQEAIATGGKSLVRGLRLALADLTERKGMPAKVDSSLFTIGEDLAATPGSVVFRNDLMELIQYAPQTEQVHAVPLLASPPWINKYYVMDLAPGRSLIEWAVQHDRTVFMISYRNPDASMASVTMDDYLEHGIRQAMDVVQQITGSDTVDVLSLCLGGAMASMNAAHLAAQDDARLGSLTLLNTILDYSEPGDLEAFVDPASLERIGVRMAETGFLGQDDMALAFDLLRSRDLIFRYVAERWLLGRTAKPFDILAWNSDATRMPAAMHSSYLGQLYGENRLARDEMELAGEQLRLGDVTCPVYVVGAVNDHIVPWTSSYRATQLFGGDVRYVLSSGGHIAGVVNPPSPKAWYEAADDDAAPPEPLPWREQAQRHEGSWWQDWLDWSAAHAGELRPAAKKVGSRKYPPIEHAPGSYVRQ